jgi:radical SAM protein with 4Fe4S-binding SPASM domain
MTQSPSSANQSGILHQPLVLTPRQQAYQQHVLQAKQSVYINYPSHVHMETLAVCTASCTFCPYPTIERQGTRMSDTLIEKIIADLKDIPAHIPFQISPFKVNEPFSDNRMPDILETINAALPNATINITTNGSMLTDKKLRQLSNLKNLAYLWISFNDHRPAEYTATMKLSWEKTIAKLDMIHQARLAGWFPVKVVLSRVGDNTEADAAFPQWVNTHYPLFQTSVVQRGGWLGQVENLLHLPPVPDVGCLRWFELSVTATGKVAHCCMDGKCEWPVGDITETHALEIYNHPEYRKLRESTVTRLDASPCNKCTFL